MDVRCRTTSDQFHIATNYHVNNVVERRSRRADKTQESDAIHPTKCSTRKKPFDRVPSEAAIMIAAGNFN